MLTARIRPRSETEHATDAFVTVGRQLQRHFAGATARLPEPGRSRRGRPSKITPELLATVRQLRAEGLSFGRIAVRIGVRRTAVARAFARAEHDAAERSAEPVASADAGADG